MQRDMELVRNILLDLEADNFVKDSGRYELEASYSRELIDYHLRIMEEAQLINGFRAERIADNRTRFTVASITWDGHEFLDKTRSPKVWEKTKTLALSEVGALSLTAIKFASEMIIKSLLETAMKP
jgi:hypothetical protein